jgi:hypothetical protein
MKRNDYDGQPENREHRNGELAAESGALVSVGIADEVENLCPCTDIPHALQLPGVQKLDKLILSC